MEYEGLVRGLHFLEENDVQIGTVITDRVKCILILNTGMMCGIFLRVCK